MGTPEGWESGLSALRPGMGIQGALAARWVGKTKYSTDSPRYRVVVGGADVLAALAPLTGSTWRHDACRSSQRQGTSPPTAVAEEDAEGSDAMPVPWWVEGSTILGMGSPRVVEKHRRQTTGVRGGDAKRTGSVNAANRVAVLNPSCQGMPLTTVSNAWCRMDANHRLPSRKTASDGPLWAGASLGSGKDQGAEGVRGPSAEKKKPPVGCGSRRPSSKPFAASAIAPDPCRGWGRNPWAHIRAQREPVVPPAGTGTEYHRPKGLP